MPPDECFQVDTDGAPMACVQQSDGSWTPEAISTGADPFALVGLVSVAIMVLGVAGVLWRIHTARSMARSAGLDEGTAVRVALASEDGLSAAYLASSLRGATGSAPAVRDTATRLRELDRLRDEGLVTEAEHASRRAAIIAEV